VTLFAFEGIGTATAMPVVARDLDSISHYTWAFTAYVIASLFAMVVGGMWADARGPRDPLLAAVIAFGVGAVIAGLAVGLPMFVVGRAVQGFGGGVLIVGLYVVIAKAYSIEARPRAFSVLAASWVLPSLIGPVVAGWLADTVSWRAVFLIVPFLVVLPTVLLLPTLRGLHEGTPQTGVRSRVVSGLMATLGLFLIQDGVLRLHVAGIAEAVVGLVLLALGLRRLLPSGAMVLRRGLPTSVMMRGFLAGAFFSAEVFIPLALVQLRGLTITGAGLVLAVSATFWFLGSFVQSRLPGQEDRSTAVRVGATVIAVALISLPLCLVSGLPAWTAAASWAVASFGMGLALPSVAVQVLRLSPEEDQGANSAAIQISDAVVSTLAVSILGLGHALAVAGGGATAATYTALWLGSAALAVVGVLAAGRMRPLRTDMPLPTDLGG
jgi:MFS family permease